MKPKAKFEFSAGGIIVYKDKILLLHRLDNNTYDIPKGHIEKNESTEETALRETKEETGYINLKITKKLEPIEYWFRQDKQLIHKRVYIFLMELLDEKRDESLMEKEEKENHENIWLTPNGALKQASFKNTKKVIERVIKIIAK